MPSDDKTYFLKRAREEEAAIRAASNPTVRARHEELASSYRLRLQYVDREAPVGRPLGLALADSDPFIAAPVPVSETTSTETMELLVSHPVAR